MRTPLTAEQGDEFRRLFLYFREEYHAARERAEAAERERDRLKASLKLVTGILATLARLEQEMRESVTDCRHVDDRRVYEWANHLAALRGKE